MDIEVMENISVNDDLCVSIKNAITRIAEKEGYIRHNIYKRIVSSEGGNYLGILYEIDIKGETAEGNKKQINIFVKQIIPNSDDVKLLSVSDVFSREVFIYTELADIFTKLQNNANIPVYERFKLVKNYNDNQTDAIILENLAKQGFKTYGRMDVMDLDYAELCVEHLAKLHGLSFIVERKMPEYFETKIKTLKQQIIIDADCKAFMNNVYEIATQKLSSDMKLKVDRWWVTVLPDYFKYLEGAMTDVKSFCHGDYKTNNIMYKDNEGNITEVIAVDYQLSHYGSPILDLIFFIFFGADQQFRRKHLDLLKDHYYVSLKKYLEYFDVSVHDVYPKKIFDNDFQECLNYGLLISFWVLPLVMISKDDAPDLGDYETMQRGLKFDDKYYERLEGIIDDYIK